MALGAALAELRLQRSATAPELPGLTAPGLLLRDLVGQYLDGRDYRTEAGRSYVHGRCRRVAADLGHLSVVALAAPDGEVVLRTWRDRLWAAGLSGRSVSDLLFQVTAILRWGQTGGRRLTGPIPARPRATRPGEVLREPVFAVWTEQDFRRLREGLFSRALVCGSLGRHLGPDRAVWEDYVARRKLYLSLAYYTGMHSADLDRIRACWLSPEIGRYERRNQKSARVIEPAWFDMPEQLARDCRAELQRLGRPWRTSDHASGCCTCEPIAAGPWPRAIPVLARETRRIWPQGGPPAFTLRVARRSTVREYAIRGWRPDEIAAILGHVDTRMVVTIYRRTREAIACSPVRVPWTVASGPHGGPSGGATVLPFAARR